MFSIMARSASRTSSRSVSAVRAVLLVSLLYFFPLSPSTIRAHLCFGPSQGPQCMHQCTQRFLHPKGHQRWSRQPKVSRAAVFSVIAEEVNNRPAFFFGEVLIIVALSAAFEKAERWLRRQLKKSGDFTGGEILDALFREITILGFIGLLLFVLTHLLPEDTPLISLGPEEYNILPETFEYVHMATFLLLVVLLFQGFAVLRISRETTETWADYESTRAFGTSPVSLESLLISEGYLRRQAVELSEEDSHKAPVELRMVKPFSYGDSVIERASLRRKYVHKLVMWRAVRHGFLFEGSRSDLLTNEGVIPGLFSFEVFLEQQLSQIVLSLVEVDALTWFYALLIVSAATGICLAFDSLNAQQVQCASCWFLAAVAFAFSIVLEEDTYELTPQVPRDPRQILRLFNGTSIQMMRRASFLGSIEEEIGPISLTGRRFRARLPDLDTSEMPHVVQPPAKESNYLQVPQYTAIFKLICFLQAAIVASLMVNLLNGSVVGADRVVPFVLACIEWPLMLFVLVPDLVRRLTLRAAVTETQDNDWVHDRQRAIVKKVMVNGIEGLLRDCARLIHLQGFEAKAFTSSATWTQSMATNQAKTGESKKVLHIRATQEARRQVQQGTELFEQLPPNLKTEVFSIFASWDARNSGAVGAEELAANIQLMGFTATYARVAKNLIRLVDDDDSGLLTWRKCRSLFMLATLARPIEDRRRDLDTFFTRIYKESPQAATVFEIARALPLQNITAEDLATLMMYRYFGRVKPDVSRAEFVEWIEAIENSDLLTKPR